MAGLKIDIIAAGKLEPDLARALGRYLDRLRSYAQVQYSAVKDEPVPYRGPQAVVARALEVEGARLLERVPDRAAVVALDREGDQWTSIQLAHFVADAERDARIGIAFLIGGTAGLAPGIREAARVRLSLSRLTLAHQLVPVVLAEQLYRAFKILRHEPYHW